MRPEPVAAGAARVGGASRNDVVLAVRAWLGTPYLHQAATRGAGADCLGLIRGIWRDIAGHEPETAPPYSADWSEAGGEERLWAAARRHLVAVKAPRPGAVLLFRMRDGAVAKHLGLVAKLAPGGVSFIHAYSGQGVVETSLSMQWRRKLVAVFDFPWISD